MKIIAKIKNLSLKNQLVLGLVIVQVLLICFFVYDLYYDQFKSFEAQLKEEARSIAETFAVGSTIPLLSHDYAGLAEINKTVSHYEHVSYAIVVQNNGKVLSHSNEDYIGKYLSDVKSLDSLEHSRTFSILDDNRNQLDVASPIISQDKIVGWVRVGISKEIFNKNMNVLLWKGVSFVLFTFIVSTFLVIWMAKLITSQLNKFIETAKKIELGNHFVRVEIETENEVGKLARVFNSMLNTLNHEEMELNRSKALLQTSEERFDLAMKGAQDGVWDWNIATGEVYYSPRWYEILGLSTEDINPNTNEWLKRIHPEDYKIAEESFLNHLNGLTARYESEHRLRHKDGHYLWTIGRGIGVKDKDGKISRVVGTQTDITELKKIEIEKEKMFIQLQQSQKMDALGQLTSGIAHDFNNILTGIMGFTELAMKLKSNSEKSKDYLQHVFALSQRARELISQMLIYSRGGDPVSKTIEIGKVIDESIAMLSPAVSEKIHIKKNYGGSNLKVKIDPVQLQQIIMNLALNAKDAMKDKIGELLIETGIELTTSHHCSSCGTTIEGNWVYFKISDNGEGMSSEIMAKMFEPFFTTKSISKGTGMGLAMVHGIVHRHQGHIVVTSKLGLGTSFTFYFPESKELKESEEEVRSEDNIKLFAKREFRILLVDDENMLREMMCDFLREDSFVCVEAENGQMALDILASDPIGFDLIISDYTMPKMNGIEFIEKLRKKLPQQLVVLTSGNIDQSMEQNIKRLNINATLSKPYALDEAKKVILNVLNSHFQYRKVS